MTLVQSADRLLNSYHKNVSEIAERTMAEQVPTSAPGLTCPEGPMAFRSSAGPEALLNHLVAIQAGCCKVLCR